MIKFEVISLPERWRTRQSWRKHRCSTHAVQITHGKSRQIVRLWVYKDALRRPGYRLRLEALQVEGKRRAGVFLTHGGSAEAFLESEQLAPAHRKPFGDTLRSAARLIFRNVSLAASLDPELTWLAAPLRAKKLNVIDVQAFPDGSVRGIIGLVQEDGTWGPWVRPAGTFTYNSATQTRCMLDTADKLDPSAGSPLAAMIPYTGGVHPEALLTEAAVAHIGVAVAKAASLGRKVTVQA